MGFSGTDAGGFKWEGFNSGAPNQGNQPPSPPRPKKPRKAIGTPFTRVLINLGLTLLVGAVYFYVELPALNLKSGDFYTFAFLLCATYCASAIVTSGSDRIRVTVHVPQPEPDAPPLLIVDSYEKYALRDGDEIRLYKAPCTLRTVKTREWNFYAKLQQKLAEN